MTMLSIVLPEALAKESQMAAKKLGVSRTQFIRIAIKHELDHFKMRLEQEKMIQSFNAMKKDKGYLKEMKDLDNHLGSNLPSEEDEWWKS